MPWARLDDDFHDNGKILSLSHPAFRLYVCAITYSRRHRTEGVLAVTQVQALCRQQRIPRPAVAELVEKHAWHQDETGYRIHDFADYQPRADETNADRQQRYRQRRKAASNAVTPPVTPATGNGTVTPLRNDPVPIPVPIPNHVTPGLRPGGDAASPTAVRPAPKPSNQAATLSAHQALFEALATRFGAPANSAERGRMAQASKLLGEASVPPEEVGVLADALEERWPNAECTPLAIANNVSRLRTPKAVPPNGAGHRGKPSPLRQNAAILHTLLHPEEA